MLKSGIIQRSNSEYSCPIHLVSKKDTGEFLLVGDYRVLKKQTGLDRFPIPS